MKKFQFSLGHMRDYKERILDEELGTLQRLKNERNQLLEQIERLDHHFQELSAQMRKAEQKGTTIWEVRSFGMQLENIRHQKKDLELSLEKAEKRVEQQTKVVVKANQEVSKLDKLEEKQYDAYRTKMQKMEEQRIEELVIQAYTQDQAG